MFKIKGKIKFDPKNYTKKHNKQSEWKRIAMLVFDCDLCDYYSWFIEKRYNLKLNRPLRGSHVTFINDALIDFDDDSEEKWEEIKNKYDGTEVEVVLDVDVRSDSKHWWLVVEHGSRKPLLDIRNEFKLGNPYWGMHMSIGWANDKNIEHSKYILGLIMKYGGSYN